MKELLHQRLLEWFDAEKRDLPWRRTRDPYAVWVSEIMLQQTQVATVVPYYERWMQRFPNVSALANADEQEILSQWQGLGYYRRCRLLQQGAKFVRENGVPTTTAAWEKVPGVGRYTAGAISSIALGKASPLVDGNVQRVFARLTANANSGATLEKEAWAWATDMVQAERPGDWNQALMELGACVCKPVAPVCSKCPLADMCGANKNSLQSTLPTKLPKAETIHLKEEVWIPFHEGSFGLHQIPPGEWWHGMWRFPGTMTNDKSLWRERLGPGRIEKLDTLTYTVTNHRIKMTASLFGTEERSQSLTWFRPDEISRLPLPSPQRRAFKMAQEQLVAPPLMAETDSVKVTLN